MAIDEIDKNCPKIQVSITPSGYSLSPCGPSDPRFSRSLYRTGGGLACGFLSSLSHESFQEERGTKVDN